MAFLSDDLRHAYERMAEREDVDISAQMRAAAAAETVPAFAAALSEAQNLIDAARRARIGDPCGILSGDTDWKYVGHATNCADQWKGGCVYEVPGGFGDYRGDAPGTISPHVTLYRDNMGNNGWRAGEFTPDGGATEDGHPTGTMAFADWTSEMFE